MNTLQTLAKKIAYQFNEPALLEQALTHRSKNKKNYERLEFLGDSMLGTIISMHLYNKVPEGDEGYLTKMRSKIVSREHLNELGKDLDLIEFVESRIPKTHFGNNIHGNVFEAQICLA